ncbi:hypothetical protein BGZ73_004900 [Actinomortierella ambigua]|nr:hypothetical protein BGZ73_004900 [Actinomortierella ambigua]
MHAILKPFTDHVVFLERIQASTQAHFPDGRFAWSTEFVPASGSARPLTIASNVFCSAGGYLPDGTLASIAGGQSSELYRQGYDGLRFYKPCNGTACDWTQNFDIRLAAKRWYPTALATGELFILGGSDRAASLNNEKINVPSFELYPKMKGRDLIEFDFLVETLPHNLYPIVHLLPDKNLFILASTKAIILSTSTWKIIKRLPDIPGPPRNYPLTGGSVLLPLTPENKYQPEVLVCGGATEFSSTARGVTSCGRIKPLAKNPTWEMEKMPLGRMMPDITLLPDRTVLIVNGANQGTAGFDRASDPVLTPVHYNPAAPKGKRFTLWNPSVIARMYHSIAMLMPDSTILVAGSNPNGKPVDYGNGPFPTEYRVEKFSPPYLLTDTAQSKIVGWPSKVHYGETFQIELKWYNIPRDIKVSFAQPGFVTHSTHMSQRLVGLEIVKKDNAKLTVKAPASNGIAPPSHYMLTVVLDGVPAVESKWVQLAA